MQTLEERREGLMKKTIAQRILYHKDLCGIDIDKILEIHAKGIYKERGKTVYCFRDGSYIIDEGKSYRCEFSSQPIKKEN